MDKKGNFIGSRAVEKGNEDPEGYIGNGAENSSEKYRIYVGRGRKHAVQYLNDLMLVPARR